MPANKEKLNEEIDSIHLNKDSIKALSAETRINILKILSQKQQTLSDLSQLLNLSAPTLKEHLQLLEKVNMIKKLEEGRKWKYYKISDKGMSLLYPEKNKIFITLSLLGVSTLAAAISFASYLSTSGAAKITSIFTSVSPVYEQGYKDTQTLATTPAIIDAAKTISQQSPAVAILFTIISIILLLILIYYITKYKNKQNKNKQNTKQKSKETRKLS